MLPKRVTDPIDYYVHQSPITDPGRYAGLFADLPGTVDGLCRAVQGLIIHYMLGETYGYRIPQERLEEVNIRYMEPMLARIVELDGRSLTQPRPPDKRLVGCCRDTATLFCAMARAKGIPTRVRVGFAAYFTKWDADFNCCHVIAEVWDAGEQRWRLVDPELDELTIRENGVRFDVCDVPRDQFLVGGKAWQMCRAGQADPDKFGVSGFEAMKGLAFVRGGVIQDLAALNNLELLNWDCWGLMLKDMKTHTDEQLRLLDKAAVLTQAGNQTFDEMQAMYEVEADLKARS
jgi:hypothetical protein